VKEGSFVDELSIERVIVSQYGRVGAAISAIVIFVKRFIWRLNWLKLTYSQPLLDVKYFKSQEEIWMTSR
jgi:hypothetical protein